MVLLHRYSATKHCNLVTRRWINGMLISLLDWDEETGELDKTTIVPLIDGQNWFYLEILIEFLADQACSLFSDI